MFYFIGIFEALLNMEKRGISATRDEIAKILISTRYVESDTYSKCLQALRHEQ